MVVFIHAYATFSSVAVESDTPVWLENTKFIVSEIISRCAVPGFFLISAMLLYRKNWSWKTNCLKKLKSLGLPYIIMNGLWIGIFFIAHQLPFIKGFIDASNLISNFSEFVDAFIGYKSGYPFLYPLWFLRDLLILNILSLVIWKLIDRFCNLMLIASLLCWIFLQKTGLFFLNLQGIFFWILGGVLVKKNIKFDFLDKIPLFWQFIIYSILVSLSFILKETVFNLPFKRITIIWGLLFWFALAWFSVKI